ncbi:MAG: RNA polymerase sigma factor [Anaerolineales bacterium]
MKISSSSSVNFSERMNASESSWLVSECTAGNQAAIEMLVRQYETGVFKLAYSIVGDEVDANEITQETFIAALRSLKTYQEKKTFKAWLYTIALNLSRSHLRKRKVIERLQSTLGSIFRVETQKQTSPEEDVIRNEKEAILWSELNKLDERHRIVVVLRYFHELPISEISDILSVNEGTIHSRLHTARERLRDALQSMHGE